MKKWYGIVAIWVVVCLTGCGKTPDIQESEPVEVAVMASEQETQEITTTEENNTAEDADTTEETNTTEVTDTEEQQLYASLNDEEIHNQLHKASTEEIEEQAYMLDNSEEYEPVEYMCEFIPQELILAAEEFLGKVSENESQSFFYEGDEFTAFGARFGSDELKLSVEDIYELFPGVCEHRDEIEDIYDAHDFLAPELEMQECCDAYGYMLDGHEYYVFVCPCGGSSSLCFVRLMERVDGELVLIEQFDTTNCGYGRVVSCQGDYYYMHMVYNYNLKNYDEVRIYRLGPDVEAENLRVCYMPESYTWTTVYENDTGAGFAEYINEVQEQLISGDYLEIGEEGVPALYLGDEEIVWDVPEEVLPRRGLYVYRTDMTNSGVPIYVVRHIFAPSGGGLSLEMDVYYYMYFQESGEYREVEALTTWGNGGRIGQGELVQMWFKEHDGKNYICQVFHIDDYKYLLNVLLMEGNQIHVVSQSIAIPNRVFSFIEKEQYHYM